MVLGKLKLNKSTESGFSIRPSRDFKFVLRSSILPEGLEFYRLENTAKNEGISIPREYFDRFRSCLRAVMDDYQRAESEGLGSERGIYAKDQQIFRLRFVSHEGLKIIIQQLIKTETSPGSLVVPIDYLGELLELFYEPKLGHTSELFERLVRYHKIFHFSFTEGSESITSNLSLRRDVLSQIDDYQPKNRLKYADSNRKSDLDELSDDIPADRLGTKALKKNISHQGRFSPKLGEKDSDPSYAVDYAAIFQSHSIRDPRALPKTADNQSKRGAEPGSMMFPLPLLASDLKTLASIPLRCDLGQDEAVSLRENFLGDREAELFLGFEIIDTIFKVQGKLKTFRFPLYYMKVNVEESGRQIFMTPSRQPDIFLNHLALSTLVESFGFEGADRGDPLEIFFNTLLAQKIEVNGRLSEFSIHKKLPLAEIFFERTREILLGAPGENGKGGILAQLRVLALESSPESVALYKAANRVSPLAVALEQDIDRIQSVADTYPDRFYKSLLGQFLSPELKVRLPKPAVFCERALCPGVLPKSTLSLLDKLNKHNLVLLEGPPGTGKTFAIMNLLIHAMNSGKKLLIVSDQKGAIHALDEKVQEFILGADYHSSESKNLLSIYRQAVKVIDCVPEGNLSLPNWMSQLINVMHLGKVLETRVVSDESLLISKISDIDAAIQDQLRLVGNGLDELMKDEQYRRLVAAKNEHPNTEQDIHDFVAFLDFSAEPSARKMVQDFILDRELLNRGVLKSCYHDFDFDPQYLSQAVENSVKNLGLLDKLLQAKPRIIDTFAQTMRGYSESALGCLIQTHWQQNFYSNKSKFRRFFTKIISFLRHPNLQLWKNLQGLAQRQQHLLNELARHRQSEAIARQFKSIHDSMRPDYKGPPSLALEASVHKHSLVADKGASTQKRLLTLRDLQKLRDETVKQLFLTRMNRIIERGRASDSKNTTSTFTSLEHILAALKDCSSINHGVGVSLLRDMQERLLASFPIWICRKQAVSFLFPSAENMFDLVVIDEAGQCRVDDAIPILYRAKKLMVVGDEKQTVLAKDSLVDDYLFRAFDLEDHLRQTQAQGMKGGGSHIFGLVKSIRQAEVMLDEHFRCPPAIIEYSNRYVYGSQLKVMQWQHRRMPAAVVVDYSEQGVKGSAKPGRGKFKDIEVDLIDRYLEFVLESIKDIEKELGRAVNVETEVALCYFLLKNEPYIKEKKPEFLRKLNRGSDILDGAGAALQGKERNFIFYLWDINRGNARFFRQGDDPDKRKGELNVLMSRPKVRAYHYLHREFAELKHDAASITDYLWHVYHQQGQQKYAAALIPRQIRPDKGRQPWQRSSGELMRAVLRRILVAKLGPKCNAVLDRSELSVVVGDPRRRIDLMLLPADTQAPAIGLIDLAAFEANSNTATLVFDYYFQLQRARPMIEPIFLYLHELSDENSQPLQYLAHLLMKYSEIK